eukprot:1196161-Prorocentrum_minimum.AAC.6
MVKVSKSGGGWSNSGACHSSDTRVLGRRPTKERKKTRLLKPAECEVSRTSNPGLDYLGLSLISGVALLCPEIIETRTISSPHPDSFVKPYLEVRLTRPIDPKTTRSPSRHARYDTRYAVCSDDGDIPAAFVISAWAFVPEELVEKFKKEFFGEPVPEDDKLFLATARAVSVKRMLQKGYGPNEKGHLRKVTNRIMCHGLHHPDKTCVDLKLTK